MNKIRVSAVSYTNTKPFVYGLQHSGILDRIDLSLDIPSDCAAKVISDEADLGLIPVAALLSIPEYHIISDFCIGADGPVDSVFLFSEKPVEEIRSVSLDAQSRTSNGLARVLLKYHWKAIAACRSYSPPGPRTSRWIRASYPPSTRPLPMALSTGRKS